MINLQQTPFTSRNSLYVKQFINQNKVSNFDLLEIHNRPSYIKQIKDAIIEIKVIVFILDNTYLLLYLKFKNKKRTFKYLINKTDNNIIKGPHRAMCIQSGGVNFISNKIAKKIIKIFKKNIAKKLGASPISIFDSFKPHSHSFFNFKKL